MKPSLFDELNSFPLSRPCFLAGPPHNLPADVAGRLAVAFLEDATPWELSQQQDARKASHCCGGSKFTKFSSKV
jgi:hypothetical protein